MHVCLCICVVVGVVGEGCRKAALPGGPEHPSAGAQGRLNLAPPCPGAARARACHQRVDTPGFKVLPLKDAIAVDGRRVRIAVARAPRAGDAAGSAGGSSGGGAALALHYFAVNKPTGVICR